MGVTLRFQTTGTVPGNGAPIVMRGTNITIGRAPENDVVLPDPDGQISRRHCVIEDQMGNISVIDLSTNGTFLNYAKFPIGQTPTPLSHGDVISLGSYELVVDITDDIDLLAPLDDGPISHGAAGNAPSAAALLDAGGPGEGDFLDDLLGAPTPKGPGKFVPEQFEDGLLPPLGDDADPLAPHTPDNGDFGASEYDHAPSGQAAFAIPTGTASAIPDDWDDDFLAPDPKPAAAPPPPAASGIPDDFDDFSDLAPTPDPTPETTTPVPAPTPAPAATQREDLAFRAFMEGAGASHMDVPSADMPMTMARLGGAFRALVEGAREVLMTRASIKGEFRINQTTLSAGKNNPLKFSTSADKALETLVKTPAKGYLPPDDAAHEAMRDIKAHEVAMVSGMEAALKGLLKRLDPEVLAGKIEGGGGVGGLLKGKKARYWEVYESMYAQISAEAEEDFHELFAREFARAYQEQMDRLK